MAVINNFGLHKGSKPPKVMFDAAAPSETIHGERPIIVTGVQVKAAPTPSGQAVN